MSPTSKPRPRRRTLIPAIVAVAGVMTVAVAATVVTVDARERARRAPVEADITVLPPHHDHTAEYLRGEWEWVSDEGRWQATLADMIEVTTFKPALPATDGHREAAALFLAEVRYFAERFEDPEVAFAEGYYHRPPFDPFHFVKDEYLDDDGHVLDPHKPEFVMYDPDTWEFLGVMFVAPYGTQGEQFGGPLTIWHYHDGGADEGVCWKGTVPWVGLQDPTGECQEGERRDWTPEMLHVWLVDDVTDPFASHMTRNG